jgi:DNA-binding transcriptional ArsR family regulator
MIQISISDRTLGGTRVASSPLWDVVASLYLLGRGGVSWPYERWAAPARAALSRPECAPLLFLARQPDAFPDFMVPEPGPGGAVDEELVRLRQTDPEVVRAELRQRFPAGDVPPTLARFAVDPEGALDRLADAYGGFWKHCMVPVEDAVNEVHDGELLLRGRAVVAAGVDGLLSSLSTLIRWRPDEGRLDLVRPTRLRIDARRRRLVLVPLVFGAGTRLMAGWDAHSVFVAYPARGAVRLMDRHQPERPCSLALLLGRGRATVLAALAEPVTTRSLARRLDLAPSTVSEHLTLLAQAGVVDRLAHGRRVYYQANRKGRALLESLG